MEYHPKATSKPSKYAKISLQERKKLIKSVLEQSLSVNAAARRLGIKSSTAKLIVRRYKEQGTFFEKRSEHLSRINPSSSQVQVHSNSPPRISKIQAQNIHLEMPPPYPVGPISPRNDSQTDEAGPFIELWNTNVFSPYITFGNFNIWPCPFGYFY